MSTVLYYGGFGLAIALLVLAAAFFVIFRIPGVIQYLRKTSRKGLVDAAEAENSRTQAAPARKSEIFADGEDKTSLLEESARENKQGDATTLLEAAGRTNAEMDRTEILR